MFDKNSFKQFFRVWAQQNLHASEIEAKEFCQNIIPPSAIVQYYWLLEQSIQWFKWLKEQQEIENYSDTASVSNNIDPVKSATGSFSFH